MVIYCALSQKWLGETSEKVSILQANVEYCKKKLKNLKKMLTLISEFDILYWQPRKMQEEMIFEN